MKILRVILALLLINSVVSAAEFESYIISYDAEKQEIGIDSTLLLDGNTSGLDFSIFTKPSNLVVTSDQEIEYRIEEEGGYRIVIDFLTPVSGNVSFSIKFNSNLVETLPDRDLFSMAFRAPLDINRLRIRLLLPETSQIYYQNNQPIVSPQARIETDGRRIILEWSGSLKQSDSYLAIASFTKPRREFPWIWATIGLLVILAVAAFAMWKFFKDKSHKPIVASMSEDEKQLFDLIKSHKGITQEDLRERTGYSKSKISKLIRNLEKMDVIRKIPYKKTNKLESKL